MKWCSLILASIFFISYSKCIGQTKLRAEGKYLVGDTLIEVKYFSDLNSIRVFKRIRGTNIESYCNYYMNTKTLKEIGTFENGHNVGIWKYYKSNGQLEKEINFDTNTKKLLSKTKEPYDSLFIFIQEKANAILAKKFGEELIKKHKNLEKN